VTHISEKMKEKNWQKQLKYCFMGDGSLFKDPWEKFGN